jgi:hypothetical protein
LCYLQAKVLASLDVGGQVVTGNLQLLLQSLVLLHLDWIDQETPGQQLLLTADLINLGLVLTELSLKGIQLTAS